MTSALPPLQLTGNLVLASGSQIRREILQNAGLAFDVVPSTVDEAAIKAAIMQEGDVDPADLAQILAEAKAGDVSGAQPGALVIGCDQTLEFEGQCLSKPETVDAARRQLLSLSGKKHHLHAAAVLVRDGVTIWRYVDTVHVTLRDISPECVGLYLAQTGKAVLESVGAYQLEGTGTHLMKSIDGDFFSVLGLPLLPLLEALRDENVIAR